MERARSSAPNAPSWWKLGDGQVKAAPPWELTYLVSASQALSRVFSRGCYIL